MIDVTVRGAGIFGLSIAWVCAQRGARVQVIDPGGPGAAASGGVVGALSPHVPENWNSKKAFQLESLLAAGPFWQHVQSTGGVDPGYARTGRLQPIADDAQLALAQKRAVNAAELWQDHAKWTVCNSSEFGGWVPPSPTGFVVHDTLSARLHPRRACAALAAALQVRGVLVMPDGPDRGAVVWATGVSGLESLNADLGFGLGSGVKGQAALLRYNAGQGPQLFAESLHFVPHADGTLAVGSTSERAFEDPKATDHHLDDLLARATQILPLLHGAEVLERWAGLRPRARSRAPVLGAHPTRPGHFVANGGFKIGFGMAPRIADVMADLVLEGRDTIPADFRLETLLDQGQKS